MSEEGIDRLKRERELLEERQKLKQLKSPWVKVAAFISAMIPLAALTHGVLERMRDRESEQNRRKEEGRKQYLDTILNHPNDLALILRQIKCGADKAHDQQFIAWVDNELETAKMLEEKEKTVRMARYAAVIDSVGKLAKDPKDESAQLEFWRHYHANLIGFESKPVSTIMVTIGDKVKECDGGKCDARRMARLEKELAGLHDALQQRVRYEAAVDMLREKSSSAGCFQ